MLFSKCLPLAATLSLTLSSLAHAQDPRAEEAFQEGIDAFEAQDWERARARLLEARRYSDNWGITCNLGRAEFEMGLFRDAAENLDRCMEALSGRADIPNYESHQKLAKDLFKRAVSRISVLRLSVVPNNATVTFSVDNRQFIGPLPHQIFVDPGTSVVSIRAAGYVGWREVIRLKPNDSHPLDAVLVPDNAPVNQSVLAPATEEEPAPHAMAKPEKPNNSAKWITVAAVGGASAVAGGTALGFWIAGQNSKSDAEKIKEELSQQDPEACSDPSATNSAACAELSDQAERADSQMNTARIMGIGFAAGAGVAVALAILWKDSPVTLETSPTAGLVSFRTVW